MGKVGKKEGEDKGEGEGGGTKGRKRERRREKGEGEGGEGEGEAEGEVKGRGREREGERKGGGEAEGEGKGERSGGKKAISGTQLYENKADLVEICITAWGEEGGTLELIWVQLIWVPFVSRDLPKGIQHVPQKHCFQMQRGPYSSYTLLEIQRSWKEWSEARMEPPVQTENFL